MANTKTLKVITAGTKEAVVYLTLAYVDAATETDYVLFDSSVVAGLVGDTDPLTSNILEIHASVSAAATARVWLEWDASTDVVALDIPVQSGPTQACFEHFGGLPNQAGSGITGDILLNATGLSTGDIITVVLRVKRQ